MAMKNKIKCSSCGMPIDEKTRCAGYADKCYHCCACGDGYIKCNSNSKKE